MNLKPCPFCGENLETNQEKGLYIHPKNGCILSFIDTEYEEIFFYMDDKKSIEEWNRRAEE
jgi:hypothetical protein